MESLEKAVLAIGDDNGIRRVTGTWSVTKAAVTKCVEGLRNHFGQQEYEKVCAIADKALGLAGEPHFRDLVNMPELWWEEGNPDGRPEWPLDPDDGAPPGLNGAADDLFTILSFEERTLFQKFLYESFESELGLDLFSVARGRSPATTEAPATIENGLAVWSTAILRRLIKTLFYSARGAMPADTHVTKCVHRLLADFPTEGGDATIEKIVTDYLPWLWDACLQDQQVFSQVLDCTDIWSGVTCVEEGWATAPEMPQVDARARKAINNLMEIIKPEVLRALGQLVYFVGYGPDSIFHIVEES